MRLGRLFIVLAFFLIVVVGGGLLYLNSQSGDGGQGDEPEVTLVDVVIVGQFIPRGGTITAEALSFAKLPASEVFPEIYILDPSTVEGARARYDLQQGVFLSSPMLLAAGEGLEAAGSDTSLDIQPGMVAIAIPIDRFSSVGYGVQRGDHINIIASLLFVDLDTEFQTALPNSTGGVISPGSTIISTIDGETEDGLADVTTLITTDELLDALTAQTVTGGSISPVGRTEFDSVLNQPFYIVPSENNQRPRLVSQTIIQDVTVVHVGDFPYGEVKAETATPADGQPGDPNAQAQEVPDENADSLKPPDIITLMVFPQEAVTLNYLMLRGAHLTLAMRASNDDSRVFTEAVTLDWLLAQYNIPVPTRLPYGFEPSIERIISPAAMDILNLILAGSSGQ